MNIRYGHTIRLLTYSQYCKENCFLDISSQEGDNSITSRRNEENSSDTPSTETLEKMLDSSYTSSPQEAMGGGYIGYYDKEGKHGVLTCVPPIGKHLEHLYREECYYILDPYQENQRNGEPVRYGETVVLVNQHGMVWNNKTGGITGYVGPRKRHIPGELYISFQKYVQDSLPNQDILPRNKRDETEYAVERSEDVMYYGDRNVFIEIEESNRHSTHYNKRLTNFKKGTSQTKGGYVCCDGNGFSLWFSLHPMEPKIQSISILPSTLVHYGDPIKIKDLGINQLLRIEMSNDSFVSLKSKELVDYGTCKKPFYKPLENGAGGIIFKIDQCFVNKTSLSLSSILPTQYINMSQSILIAALLLMVLFFCISSFWAFSLQLVVLIAAVIWIRKDQKSVTCTMTLCKWYFHPERRKEESMTRVRVPERYLRATKGNKAEALDRWKKTLIWRKQENMDTILKEPQKYFDVIKKYYPHFFHKRGRENEPVYYEKPAKIDLKSLREAGVTMDDLLRHYALMTEFLWTKLEPSEEGQSITVIDLDGIGVRDFAGEAVDFVKKASHFTGAHYPERAAAIFVLNAPSWFGVVWNVVKAFVDEETKKKVHILRAKDSIFEELEKKICKENIPVEYGGLSEGNSKEELLFRGLVAFNNGIGPDPFQEKAIEDGAESSGSESTISLNTMDGKEESV